MEEPAIFGIDLGDPAGNRCAVVYFIPAGAESELRAFFGGALPDWVQVMPKPPRIVESPLLQLEMPAPRRRRTR